MILAEILYSGLICKKLVTIQLHFICARSDKAHGISLRSLTSEQLQHNGLGSFFRLPVPPLELFIILMLCKQTQMDK